MFITTQTRWLVLALIFTASFIMVADMTVLYAALPGLTRDLSASASEKLWIVNVYSLVVAGLLPGFGTLGDRLGHRRLFITGLAIFGIASLIAAFSPSSAILIAARALLAVGAAMMMPATLSIIRQTFENQRERSFAIGIWAAGASGGAAFGPVIGGILLEYFWWGSVFLINVPIVFIVLLLTVAVMPACAGNKDSPWDLLSSIQITFGLIGIAYGLKELGKRLPSYESATLAIVLGLALIITFIHNQRRSAAPMIDFALFRNRSFTAGVVAALIASAVLVGMNLILSQRLQMVLGLSPLQAGLAVLPIPLAAIVAGPMTGLILPALQPERVMWMSLLVAGAGLTLYLFAYETSTALQVVAFIIFGFGTGGTMTAASTAIMLNAPINRAGMAASIEEVSFELGGGIGIGLMGSLMSALYTASMAVPGKLAASDSVRDSIDKALDIAQGLAPPLGSQLTRLAHSAFDSAFFVVLIFAVSLLFTTVIALAASGSSVTYLSGQPEP